MPKGQFSPLTVDQEEKIKNEFLTKPIKRLADELNISFARIMRFLAKNGLEVPPELVAQRKRDSLRKKGDPSFNKGLKQKDYMTPEAIERTKATRFQKGHTPHNTHKEGNGAIVSRRDTAGRIYKYIRISKGVWELYHRELWEQHNGKIPKEHVVVFKDGNSENVHLENLKLISMIENMYRNGKYQFPKEVIPSMVLIKQLENKLNKLQDGK